MQVYQIDFIIGIRYSSRGPRSSAQGCSAHSDELEHNVGGKAESVESELDVVTTGLTPKAS